MGNFSPLLLSQDSLVLAPLEGITTAAYRRVFFRQTAGVDGGIAPFIGTIRELRRYDYHLRDILPEVNIQDKPLIPQILGRDPEGVEFVARACADLGYTQVNWNIGCPVPNVVRKKRGSGILPFPDLVEKVLDRACRPGLPAFSVKMRLGLENSDEWRQLLPVLNRHRLDFIVLHPRTGRQMYRGVPNLAAYGQFLGQSAHPVCYSGDIRTREDYLRLKTDFPETRGWMLGRGVLSRPVLSDEIGRGCNLPYSSKNALSFLEALRDELLTDGHDKQWILGKMKLHFSYLKNGCDDFDQAQNLWQQLRLLRSWDEFSGFLRSQSF